MGALRIGAAATLTPTRWTGYRLAATIVLALAVISGSARPLSAAKPSGSRSDHRQATTSQASTSRAARLSAVRSIPFERLDPDARGKVGSVLSNVTAFRRMPTQVIGCDPALYLFLVRHPDVVVNIWEVLKISNLKLRQIDEDTYRVVESNGTLANVEFLYRSHDTHVIYAQGSYDGPLFVHPVKGRCLMVLKTGYFRGGDGRYYVTTRLDTFLHVEPGGAELLTRAFHPLVGKVADTNFLQTVGFLGSLSRTAEVNHRGVQRLAGNLRHVKPQYRRELAALAAEVARKSSRLSLRPTTAPPLVAASTRKKKNID